jgi:hypothetical protein
LPPQTKKKRHIRKGMFPYYWVHSEIKETCTRMQAFSSITMNNVDKEGQQESVTWGGEKKKKDKRN